jgi:hypothetical protein
MQPFSLEASPPPPEKHAASIGAWQAGWAAALRGVERGDLPLSSGASQGRVDVRLRRLQDE